ncbi:MAG: PD40 domain-containing protein [Candidatus Riflebacteria bacterium]|nr:PD40 domain-containing protein [Candidatus Riflebacteria bacterium]
MARFVVYLAVGLTLVLPVWASGPGAYLVSSRVSQDPAQLWEYDLYLVEGTRRRQLTDLAGPEGEPAVHARSGRFAFVAAPRGRFQVLTSSFGSSTVRKHGAGFDHCGHPSFDPEGRRLVYPADPGDGRFVLVIEDLETGGQERLTTGPGNSLNPEWSPDGRFIVFVSDDPGEAESGWRGRPLLRPGQVLAPLPGSRRPQTWLYRHDLRTGQTTRLTRGEGADRDPAFSPDGASLAFSRRLGTWEAHVMVMDFADGRIRPLTDEANLNLQPAFSPDGRGLYFTSSRSGGFKIWFKDLVGGSLTRLTEGTPSEQRACPVASAHRQDTRGTE